MPQHLDGVITVSPREAKCAIDRFPQLLVVAPMRDIDQLPNAVPVPLLAFDVIFARSVVLTLVRRSVRWRGREVDLRRRASVEEGA